jgi:flavin reductase (DIM6/NTAB) family NADH-FMN oxidoreductase RutF
MQINPTIVKQVMSRFATGVTIVTVQHEGQKHGLTASSFTSLSLAPPLVLVCVGKRAYSHELICQSRAFAVNILGQEQLEWGRRFANPAIADRFAGVDPCVAVTGSPILPGCLAWVDCRLHDAYAGGDHTIFIGEVIAGDIATPECPAAAQPLLYFNRNWRQLAMDVPSPQPT